MTEAKKFNFIIIELLRVNWIETGNSETTIKTIQETITPSSEGGIDKDVEKEWRTALSNLQEQGFVAVDGDTVRCTIPFRIITNTVLPEIAVKLAERKNAQEKVPLNRNEILTIFESHFPGRSEELISLFEDLEILQFSQDSLVFSVSHRSESILDTTLTYIDKQDALLIKYGIYDTEISGRDVLASLEIPNDPLKIGVEYSLRKIKRDGFLLPLHYEEEILNWRFRSRIGEIVRLLQKLRQRFEFQTVREAKNLTRAVKLEVFDRKFPRLDIPIEDSVHELRDLLENNERLAGNDPEQLASEFIAALNESKFRHISGFQYRTFHKVFSHLISEPRTKKKGLIVTAGTGTGKTLSYIVPLLFYTLLVNKEMNGTKAINVYPRIKLAENQIAGFVKMLYYINKRIPDRKITIGIDYSGTPYERRHFANEPSGRGDRKTLNTNGIDRLWEYDESFDAYICPYAKCPACGGDLYISRNTSFSEFKPLKCESCGETIDYIRYTKQDIGASPPDILIITTEMLTKNIGSRDYQNVFGNDVFCAPALLLIDEVHLHTSLKGTQVAMVIRRLVQRITEGKKFNSVKTPEPIIIGLSATIGQEKEFFSELTGIDRHNI